MLNTDHLVTFLAVAETGSFTAAATRMGFTQPAVSQHIKLLESQIGEVRLFRRVGKSMQLTHAGEELLAFAREVVTVSERAEQHMQSLRGHLIGRISLGCAPNGGERMLPTLLTAFHRQYSDVQFGIDVGLSERMLAWLANGQVQMVMVDEHPRRRAFDVLELGNEAVVPIVGRGHALARGGSVSAASLRSASLILPQRGMAIRRVIEDVFRRQGVAISPQQIVLETDSSSAALQAAIDGLGLAFVPRCRVPRSRSIVTLPIADLVIEQQWFLVRQRGVTVNRAVDELWEFVAGSEGQSVCAGMGLSAPVTTGA